MIFGRDYEIGTNHKAITIRCVNKSSLGYVGGVVDAMGGVVRRVGWGQVGARLDLPGPQL